MARRQVSAYHATRANRRRLRFFRLPMIECCTCGGLNAAYDIIVRDDTQGGILIFFNFFFGRRNGGGLDIPPIYGPYWYNDARVYQSVYQLSTKSLSIFFYRKNSTQYPTPPMSPKHHLSTRPKFSVMQSARNTISVVESVILLD